ncbi:LacI family transcriptional regulator [Agromyces sp. 3263]|uniref:LacI family DNA-binding transcriptional regulator n=1 Tax=Agromyces sp. 3263 TaxID=2817750 RepID=UPI00285491F7|nr:LacI family DNA-binding transcriptional regulator [Agromyces sp. 3263]MDR6905133.1 LacI family transcriptional regulator [Agromyces sp. 3263]
MEPSGRPATIYDVAQAAGVSHQTVSRFLKGFTGIRPETRQRVERALDELGYRPNLTARSLKSGRSHRIGALTHEVSHVGPSRIAQGASVAAREAGYVLDLVSLDVEDPRAIEESLELMAQFDLAGVLALSSTDAMTRAFEATRFRVPVLIAVASDDDGRRTDPAAVHLHELVGHLAGLGHRRLVHIAGPAEWPASRLRLRAYDDAVRDLGLASVGVLSGDWSARSGYDAIMALPELPEATAYLAANDQTALGAMLALKERGLRIPDDVSVVGIDDVADAAFFDPPLTTLHLEFEAQGRASVLQLIGSIEGVDGSRPDLPTPHLVVRGSSGPAPASTRP